MELVERFGRLRIQVDVAGEVKSLDVIKVLNNDGLAMSLSNQSQHFCMSLLAEDDNLRKRKALILFLDALL